jgi:hypothetical protein
MVHPIKGYGPSLSDQGVGPEDAGYDTGVANGHGCRVEYDRETGEPSIRFCADHHADDHAAEVAQVADELEQARAALAAARPYVGGLVEYPEHSRDEVLEQIDAALSRER